MQQRARYLVLCVSAALLMPVTAAADALTHRDVVSVSMAEVEFVEVSQMLKRSPPSAADQPLQVPPSQMLHETCTLRLQLAETHSFDGISALSMSANVASTMPEPEDNMAMQSAATEARSLMITLASEKMSVRATVSGCRQFADIKEVGQNLIAAIDTASAATSNIAQKLATVQVDEGGHQP